MRLSRAFAATAGGAAVLAACAGPRGPERSNARVGPDRDATISVGPPARWDFHPPPPETLLAVHRLADGTCIVTAPRGQRWRIGPPSPGADASAGRACTGPALASTAIAPEDLVQIVRRGPSSWLFASESGTLYEASDPLGSLSRRAPAPEPLVRVAGSGARVVGVTADGRLLRWQEPTGWAAMRAPDGAYVLDLAAAPNGALVALTMPEALVSSDDGGETWRRLWPDPAVGTGAPGVAGSPGLVTTIGARRLGSSVDGDLAAEGLVESLAIRLRSTPTIVRGTTRVLDGPGVPPLSPLRSPSAAAVLAGRAAIDGDRYVEVLEPEADHDAFVLARGRLEGTLASKPVPGTERCEDAVVAMAGRHVAVACVPKGAGIVRLFRSNDGGDSFSTLEATLALGSGSVVRLAISPAGTILVTGACRPGDADTCKPHAPMTVPAGVGRARPAIGADLNDVLAAPVFSTDGRRAYVLGRRAKDDRIALFVSHDGGETFLSRPLDPPGSERPDDELPPSEEEDEEGEGPPRRSEHDEFDVADGTLLRPGEDGTIGVVLRRPRGEVWVTTDEDGRLAGVAYPPEDGATIAGIGRRVLAIASRSESPASDRRLARVWESMDGGATWTEVAGTRALEEELATGALGSVCATGGCLFGDSVSRVGWGGAGPPAPSEVEDSAPTGAPAVGSTIVCEAAPGSRWTRIDDAVEPPPKVDALMRGRSMWSIATFDHKTTAVTLVSAMLPEGDVGSARIVTRTLLGRRGSIDRVAVALSRQMEGYAVLRVDLPLDRRKKLEKGARVHNVEVAWENWMDGTHGRATLGDVGPLEPEDVVLDDQGGPHRYEAGLVSVSPRGVFVRPHRAGPTKNRTFFVDDRGRIQSFDLPRLPEQGLRGPLRFQHEAVAVDGRPVSVAMLLDPGGGISSVLTAGRSGDDWTSWAHAVTPHWDRRVLETRVEWTYLGDHVGLVTVGATRGHERAFGTFRAFRADGSLAPPIAVPTQLDLGDRPSPCSPTERTTTPRVEAPVLLGRRHPVTLADPDTGAPLLFLTEDAVVHGTPSKPCIAAWSATQAKRGAMTVLVGGDPARSWIFRPASKEGEPLAIEARPLACRFEPAAAPPEAVFDEPLTIRTIR